MDLVRGATIWKKHGYLHSQNVCLWDARKAHWGWCYTQALLAVKPWSECGCAVNVNGGYSSTSWPKASGCTLGGTCSPLSSWTKFLVYTAYAKVHLLSGQPQNAVSIIDELMQERKGDMDYKLAVDYLQALLIMCHSSLSSAHMTSLHQFLDKGATIVARKSAKSGKQNWKSLKMLSQKLLSSPENLCFKDLLVTSTASQSLMQDWENYQAGTNYLPLRDWKLVSSWEIARGSCREGIGKLY